jgi:hypothetical protein
MLALLLQPLEAREVSASEKSIVMHIFPPTNAQ